MQNIIITLCGQCGNAVVKVCEKVCSCPQIIEQNTTNQYNEKIVNTICGTLTEIAIIAALMVIILHIVRYIANNCKEKKGRKYKQEQRDFELKKEYQAKVLDYLKGEIDSYKKLPNLISELQKVSEKIDEIKVNNFNIEMTKDNKLIEGKPEETKDDKHTKERPIEKKKEETTISNVKEALGKILYTIKCDKKFWESLFDKEKEGNLVFNKTDIIDQEKNLYLKTLNDYIENNTQENES